MMAAPGSCVLLLRAMVGIDTVNHHISGRPAPERPLALHLESVSADMGLSTQRLPLDDEGFNLLVSVAVADTAPWLLFECHMDTVSVEGMSIDPFAALVKDRRLYGRGACDTKGTGAAMLWALRRYVDGPDRPNNVAIVFTTDEEIAKTGIRAFTQRHLPALGWRPAGAIVGEPTRLRPIVAHNGVVRWTIRTLGVAAHSADPTKGKSAISMMAKVIDAIESHYAPALRAAHPLTGPAHCTINVIRGGTQVNVIPDCCVIHLDRRVVPGESPDQVLPAVQRVLDDLCQRHPDMVVRQDPPFLDLPLDPAGNQAFGALARSALERLGLDPTLTGAPYGTDASELASAGVPTIVLGPGDIAQAHTADEWLDLGQLERGVELYHQLMRQRLSRSGDHAAGHAGRRR